MDKKILEEGQPDGFADLKALVDAGDIVGAVGGLRRTEKGELSVVVTSLQVRQAAVIRLLRAGRGSTRLGAAAPVLCCELETLAAAPHRC